MGRHGGRDDKRARRAREQIDKALGRRDLDLALSALFELDQADRGEPLVRVAPFYRRSLSELRRAGDWARLHTMAARAEQEPRLLSCGAAGEEVARARWPLLLSCLRARDWARAGRLEQELRPAIAGRAPDLAAIVGAWIEGRGDIAPAVLDALGETASATPSLPRPTGPRQSAPMPPPAEMTSVPAAVLGLFAAQPAAAVADTVLAWRRGARPDIAAESGALAISLAVRELVLAAEQGASLADAATLLARLAADGVPDGASADDLVLALRVLLPEVRGPVARMPQLQAVSTLATALAGREAWRRDMAGWAASLPVADTNLGPTACAAVLGHGPLFDRDLFFGVWVRGLAGHAACVGHACDREEEPPPVPAWLQSATRAAVSRGTELGRWLSEREPQDRIAFVDMLVDALPPLLASDVIDAAWGTASEDVRRCMAGAVGDIAFHAQEEAIDRLYSNPVLDLGTVERLAKVESVDPDAPTPLIAEGRAIWRRLGPRALAYDYELLLPAFLDADTPRDEQAVVSAHLGDGSRIEAYLELMRQASSIGTERLRRLCKDLGERMLARFAGQLAPLAAGLAWADERGGPLPLRFEMARRVLKLAEDADTTDGLAPAAQEGLKIACEMYNLDKPRRKRREASKTPRRKRKPKPCAAAGHEQLRLPIEERD